MRLQQPLYVRKRVSHIDLRIKSRGLPDGAHVDITDVQLQLGVDVSGYTPINPEEYGTVEGHQWHINGTLHPYLEAVALANPDRPSPTRVEVLNAATGSRVGTYRFESPGRTVADGINRQATNGWGRVPLITSRSDLYLKPYLDERMQMRVSWRDREPGEGELT